MSFFTDPLFLRALLAGGGVALMAGPLGCFVVWRRLSYFGDALSHAALLGVAAGLILHTSVAAGVAAVALLAAALLTVLSRRKTLAQDALLGVLSHGALALALVALALADIRVDMQAYLFGDVLAVNPHDLYFILGVAALVLAALAWQWRSLVFMAVSEDIARVEGVRTARAAALLMALIALSVAAALPVVGALLITALLVIPPSAARSLSHSPEGMAVSASAIGLFSVGAGLSAAFMADTPAGPSIILAAIVCFVAARLLERICQ